MPDSTPDYESGRRGSIPLPSTKNNGLLYNGITPDFESGNWSSILCGPAIL
jgi:hypothetical protein